MKKIKRVYLDYAATTPVDPLVLKAMLPYFTDKFGNSSSLHWFGVIAKEALEKSRKVIAHFLGASLEEIVFTSSASESNNLALKGVAFANREKGNHIIVSSIEHDCILNASQWLENQGFEISYLPVDQYGLVNPKDVEREIKKETILVSVMQANNEVGTIEPIEKIGQICRNRGVYFHTDAAQTFDKIAINVEKMKIDLLTASSHKIYGPKGAAILYVKKGVKIEPIIHGGGQEFGLRSSTVNVPAIVGFAKAVEIADKNMDRENQRVTRLRDRLINGVLKAIPDSSLNGHPQKRLANNANFRFSFIEGESIILSLDNYGIAGSTGSACSSPKLTPSHVLLAMGLRHEQAHGSLRLTLGRWTTEKEIDYTLKILAKVIKNLRRISPFKNK